MRQAWIPSIPPKSKLTEIHRLRWDAGINLRQYYTIRYSFVLQKISLWLLAYLCSVLLIIVLHTFESPFMGPGIRTVITAMLVTGAFLIFGLAIFWWLYLKSLDIQMEGLRLTYSRGVVRKSTGSLVMRGHNVVNVFQTLPDYLLGVYQLQVFGSNQPHTDYALIPALSAEDAFDLFRFFTSNLSKQTKVQSVR